MVEHMHNLILHMNLHIGFQWEEENDMAIWIAIGAAILCAWYVLFANKKSK